MLAMLVSTSGPPITMASAPAAGIAVDDEQARVDVELQDAIDSLLLVGITERQLLQAYATARELGPARRPLRGGRWSGWILGFVRGFSPHAHASDR